MASALRQAAGGGSASVSPSDHAPQAASGATGSWSSGEVIDLEAGSRTTKNELAPPGKLSTEGFLEQHSKTSGLTMAPAQPTMDSGERPRPAKGLGEEKPASADELWCGPYQCGPLVLELYGPLQALFIFLAFVALVLLIIECARDDRDPLRIVVASFLFVVLVYLVWLGKSIYVLKRFQKQITCFKELNRKLEGQLDNLESQNKSYKEKNDEHEKLNVQLRAEVKDLGAQTEAYSKQNAEHQRLNENLTSANRKLSGEVQNLATQSETYRQQNAKQELNISKLEEKVNDLTHVEKQLAMLSNECNGSVEQARGLLERLERNLRLDTVNTVFLFFDRIDKDKTGTLEVSEISLFVDNLSFLWKHLPSFDKERMKQKLIEQGGITLEQVHALVDGMLMEEDKKAPEDLAHKLEQTFSKTGELTQLLTDVAATPVGDDGTNPFSADVAAEDTTAE